MDKAENKTYYYPSSRGVTPADHDVAYWDEYQPDKETGGWRDWKAHLLIENPLPFRAYLENIEGHYIKGVASWQEAHEELIDLVQAMLEELRGVAEDSSYEQKGVEQSYKAYIVEVYGDGIEIHYSCSQEQGEEIELSVFSSADIEEYLLSDEALLDLNHLR